MISEKLFLCFIAVVMLFFMGGCYQIHSDDDLRTVPTTNNPHLINDVRSGAPGIGY
jgi:hypothetical protein